MAVAKDQIRQIITENNITSVADVYSLLKDSFKDILQELLEAEMDATLGYEKNCKGDLKSDNKRNGHSSKTLKSQYGEFQIDVPRDRNGEFEPKLILKLADKYSAERLEAACRKALSYTASPSYKSIKNILAAGQEKIEPELQTSDSASTQNKHAITRGADYYRR